MTKDEVLRLALEAMEKITKQMLALRDELAERGSRPKNNLVHQELWDSSYDVYVNCALPTAEAILNALEAKVEPVAVVSGYYGGQCVVLPTDPARLFNSGTAFYTTPPDTRILQVISDEYNAWIRYHAAGGSFDEFLKVTLKEKNT